MTKKVLVAVAVLGLVTAANAITITAPTLTVDRSKNSSVSGDVLVSGGDAVQGLNLILKVDGPLKFSAVDFTGPGTVFAGMGANSQIFVDVGGPIFAGSVTTLSGTVPAAGVLAKITLDLGNVPVPKTPLTFKISPMVDQDNMSDFAGVPATLVDGTITVTPEPAAALLLAVGGLLLRRRSA